MVVPQSLGTALVNGSLLAFGQGLVSSGLPVFGQGSRQW
jgi:hypothetical protein